LKETKDIKIFLVDNYDSFTYNLVHYVETFGVEITVKRNNELSIEELDDYDKIILSPGPGLPKDAGLMMKIIETYHHSKPILGVCLGHQALLEFYGGKLVNLDEVHHGVSSQIKVDNSHFLFQNMDKIQEVGRYHSWAVANLPKEIKEIGKTIDKGTNMAFSHKKHESVGVQFHPESILTPNGLEMIKNWLFN